MPMSMSTFTEAKGRRRHRVEPHVGQADDDVSRTLRTEVDVRDAAVIGLEREYEPLPRAPPKRSVVRIGR